jgi:hypothetical protein
MYLSYNILGSSQSQAQYNKYPKLTHDYVHFSVESPAIKRWKWYTAEVPQKSRSIARRCIGTSFCYTPRGCNHRALDGDFWHGAVYSLTLLLLIGTCPKGLQSASSYLLLSLAEAKLSGQRILFCKKWSMTATIWNRVVKIPYVIKQSSRRKGASIPNRSNSTKGR